jgi:hypothetical protein
MCCENTMVITGQNQGITNTAAVYYLQSYLKEMLDLN